VFEALRLTFDLGQCCSELAARYVQWGAGGFAWEVKMPKLLPVTLLTALMVMASTALANEQSELESSSVKAATDCVAAAASNDPNIISLYQENRLKQITDRIVLHSEVCENPLRAMRLLHDRLYGEGTGRHFLLGEYLADLPRAVRERIRVEVARRFASRPDVGGSYGTAYPGIPDSVILNHNGSIMSLVEGGDGSRIIYYQVPRPVMAEIGVRRGTMLFEGYETNGRWLGTAYLFKWDCPPIPYRVEGHLYYNDVGGSFVHLRGLAPDEYIGCTPVSYSWNHNSELIFDYITR
jgi:hypothetical protein